MAFPRDVYFDGTRLFVVDGGNNRVMVWNGIPTANDAPADYVIGQFFMNANGANAGNASVNAVGMNSPFGVAEGLGSLFISDTGNNRVLVYTPVPIASGATASAVLGQDTFVTSTAAMTPAGNRLSSPVGLRGSGNNLWVVDQVWSRVLRFALTP